MIVVVVPVLALVHARVGYVQAWSRGRARQTSVVGIRFRHRYPNGRGRTTPGCEGCSVERLADLRYGLRHLV